MQSRIPLSIVFSAEGKRHTIPHCTFRVPVNHSVGANATNAVKEGVAFFRYLDSNDTRMPSHPHLRAYAQPAEEYETYVGEEVWEREAAGEKKAPATASATISANVDVSKDGSGNVCDAETQASSSLNAAKHSTDAEILAPVPAFDSVVNWVDRVFDEEYWTADGVVLCGRYVVADDGAWVVPSRSPTLYSTREVFLLMRNSCKFLQDVHTQMKASGSAPTSYFEFTLAKSLAGPGASEMRAILPYPLRFSSCLRAWVADETAASIAFTGIGQRMTDACFPSLMAWTEDEHNKHFRLMQRRMEQAALLERTCEVSPDFISRLVERFQKRRGSSQRTAAQLTLLLAVDLLFEGPSLPIYILSAKARVFEVVQRTDTEWDSLHGTTMPWPLWTPLLKSLENTEVESVPDSGVAVGVTGRSGYLAQAETVSPQTILYNACVVEGAEESSSDDEEENGGEAATLNFFRMFRDIEHWNQYVMAMVQRLHHAAATSATSPESNKPPRNAQHYCVIASESDDLITCSDTLTKRGLPLELVHPELLELNEDTAVFLKMLRDGLFKRSSDQN